MFEWYVYAKWLRNQWFPFITFQLVEFALRTTHNHYPQRSNWTNETNMRFFLSHDFFSSFNSIWWWHCYCSESQSTFISLLSLFWGVKIMKHEKCCGIFFCFLSHQRSRTIDPNNVPWNRAYRMPRCRKWAVYWTFDGLSLFCLIFFFFNHKSWLAK